MKHDVTVKPGIVIPAHEIEISTSRSGGAGGQHLNVTNTRVTVHWNVKNTSALTTEQKERVLQKLHNRLSQEGDLIIHNSESRSQMHNKKMALLQLAKEVSKALHVPKKRMKTAISASAKAARIEGKRHRGEIKQLRKKIEIE
jgi:ribosome-associated protein